MAQVKPASQAMTPAKKKQIILLGGGAAIVVAVSLAAGIIADKSRDKPIEEAKADAPVSLTVSTPGAQLSDSDVWRANEAAKIEALKQELEDMKQRQSVGAQSVGERAQIGNLMPPGVTGMRGPSGDMPLPPPPPPPSGGVSPAIGPAASAREMPPGSPAGGPQAEPAPPVKRLYALEVPGSKAVQAAAPVAVAPTATAAAKPAAARDAGPTAQDYLPAGTFVRAVLLAGLDAPTGGQAQNNPHPVLMRVLDSAQLPNSFRSDIRECVVTGNGYGDISSERAYLRLDRLSCVRRSGGAVDVALKGYVAGEDGKAGMRGRLISKQGQALANAFLAGIGSGIGQAFRDSSTTQSTSALGTTSSVTQGKELEAGFGAGVGSAMSQLSKYYIKLAEQVFPVIEIDGGRVVDVVLTRGTSLGVEEGQQ